MSKLLSPSIAQTKFDNLKWPILAYGLIFGLYIAYLPGKFVWFSWHPLSMLVSFVVLASNASLIKKIGGRDNTMTHGYMMVLAVVISMFGWYVIHTNKDMSNKPHWTTLHAQVWHQSIPMSQ